jgi:hypothetical protein
MPCHAMPTQQYIQPLNFQMSDCAASPRRIPRQPTLEPFALPLPVPLVFVDRLALALTLMLRLRLNIQRTERLGQRGAICAPAVDVDEHHNGEGQADEEGEEPEGLWLVG